MIAAVAIVAVVAVFVVVVVIIVVMVVTVDVAVVVVVFGAGTTFCGSILVVTVGLYVASAVHVQYCWY